MQITVNNNVYTIGKLDALKQFHLMRRLAPVLATVGLDIAKLKNLDSGLGGAGDAETNFLELLAPVVEVVGKMTDEDSNYIIFTCLSAVARQSPTGGFSPVTTAQNQLMFQDIDMLTMLRLSAEVVRENLRGFFSGLGEGTNLPSS